MNSKHNLARCSFDHSNQNSKTIRENHHHRNITCTYRYHSPPPHPNMDQLYRGSRWEGEQLVRETQQRIFSASSFIQSSNFSSTLIICNRTRTRYLSRGSGNYLLVKERKVNIFHISNDHVYFLQQRNTDPLTCCKHSIFRTYSNHTHGQPHHISNILYDE